MKFSPLHQQWKRRKREVVLEHHHDIVEQFIDRNENDIGNEGIRAEYRKVEEALSNGNWEEIDDKRFIRYG